MMEVTVIELFLAVFLGTLPMLAVLCWMAYRLGKVTTKVEALQKEQSEKR